MGPTNGPYRSSGSRSKVSAPSRYTDRSHPVGSMAINVQTKSTTITISRMAVLGLTGLMIEERINHHPSIGGSGGPATQAPGGSKGILSARTLNSWQNSILHRCRTALILHLRLLLTLEQKPLVHFRCVLPFSLAIIPDQNQWNQNGCHAPRSGNNDDHLR